MDADERRLAGQTGAASPALRRALGRLDGGGGKIKSALTPNVNDVINVNVPATMASDPAAVQKIGVEVRRAIRAEVVDVMREQRRRGNMYFPNAIT
jgi:hypothetical protein